MKTDATRTVYRLISILVLLMGPVPGTPRGVGSGGIGNTMNDSTISGPARKHSPVPFVLRLSEYGTEKVAAILDSTKSVQMRSGYVNLKPGENIGSHNTGEHEELLIILEGTGTADIGGFGRKNIAKGMLVYIPPHNQHDISCSGTSRLEYIYVVAPVR